MEPILRYRHSLEPELVLAENFEYNDDRTKATLRLKPDLKYHDGSPVTVDDILFALDLIEHPAKYNVKGAIQLAGFTKFITATNKVDDLTLEFTFDRAHYNMTDLFAQLIVTKASTYTELMSGKNIHGTGPFRFESWRTGQGFSLVAQPRLACKDRHIRAVSRWHRCQAVRGHPV